MKPSDRIDELVKAEAVKLGYEENVYVPNDVFKLVCHNAIVTCLDEWHEEIDKRFAALSEEMALRGIL